MNTYICVNCGRLEHDCLCKKHAVSSSGFSDLVLLHDVIKVLNDKEVLEGYALKPLDKPTHGNCCTCQDCGRCHDDCICSHNEIFAALIDLQETTDRTQ